MRFDRQQEPDTQLAREQNKDIHRSHSSSREPTFTSPPTFRSLARQIAEVRASKNLKTFESHQQVAQIVQNDLQRRGRFYHNSHGTYYFFDAAKQLIEIHHENTPLVLLLHEYGLNPTEAIFKYVVAHLDTIARKEGTESDVHRITYYAEETQTVYLYNHANQIYRITDHELDLVDNGTNGVLFLDDDQAEPFTIGVPTKSGSLLDRYIFGPPNFSDDILTADERRLILLIWFYSLFFPSLMPTRPILAFIGEKGSGKSMGLRKMGRLLFGDKFDVMPLPSKEDDFDAAITNSAFVAIDNADNRCPWLEDRLAIAATGGKINKRILYTTNNVVKIPVKTHLAITSRTPRFKRDDVADRTLIMRMERPHSFKSQRTLLREISKNRDAIMTEVVGHIQEILCALKKFGADDDSSAFRMADFGSFAMKLGRYCGAEGQVRRIFEKLMSEQSAWTLEDDPLMDLMTQWVDENENKWITATDLCTELSKIANERGIDFYYRGKERAFALKFSNLRANLEQYFEISQETRGQRRRFFAFARRSGGAV